MKLEDDIKLQLRGRTSLRQADAELPVEVRHRLSATRHQARREARLAAGTVNRGDHWLLLGWSSGALAAASLLALLWSPLTTPPDASLPVVVLPDEPDQGVDMQLLLDDDFALLAVSDTALDSEEALAFYVWVGLADAEQAAPGSINPRPTATDAMETGS